MGSRVNVLSHNFCSPDDVQPMLPWGRSLAYLHVDERKCMCPSLPDPGLVKDRTCFSNVKIQSLEKWADEAMAGHGFVIDPRRRVPHGDN